MQATGLWSLWLSLTLRCASGFTTPGRHRFVEWVTALAINDEEHTITQSLLGIDRTADWKALETFVEVGHWDLERLQQSTAELVDSAAGRLKYGYRVWAGDDTKVHRNSAQVWGTCTYHEY